MFTGAVGFIVGYLVFTDFIGFAMGIVWFLVPISVVGFMTGIVCLRSSTPVRCLIALRKKRHKRIR
jgi:predicted membrane protein